MSYRDWCFTAWELPKWDKDKCRYICWGLEKCPSTNRDHYQGFAIFRSTCRMRGAKGRIGAGDGAHVEQRRGTRYEARDYCRKDGEFFEWGEFDGMTKEELFKQPIEYIKENYPEFYCRYHRGLEKLNVDKGPEWRELSVTVLWGEPDRFKSRRARMCDSYYVCEEPYKWFDHYEGEKRLILDDFEIEKMSVTRLKRLLDGYRIMLETKGGHVWGKWTEVFITTNEDPREWMVHKGLKKRLNRIIECTEEVWEDVSM